MEHRGRFQVHREGSLLLGSEPWDAPNPLQARVAHLMVERLNDRTPRKEQVVLVLAFQKTHDLIEKVAANGFHGAYRSSWPWRPALG